MREMNRKNNLPARIVLDARWVLPQLSGIGRYTLELLRRLGGLGSEFQFTVWALSEERREFIVGEAGLKDQDNVQVNVLGQGPFSLSGQWAAARRLKEIGAGLYHSTNFMIPLPAFPRRRPHRVACVCNIHDLIPLLHPEFTPHALKSRFFPVYRGLMHEIARRTDWVVTGSAAAKRDIVGQLPIAAERITAIWDGVDARYSPEPDGVRGASTGEGCAKTILYVGRADPYKNVTGLLEAFAILVREGLDVRLRIAGPPDLRYPEPQALARRLGVDHCVEWAGYLGDAELVQAYRRADVLALLSRYEGFGLPVAEAMACGTPVVCSNTASLPEIAGKAALLVSPDDASAAAAALREVLTNRELAARLRAEGLRQAARFSWEAAAAAVVEVYREVLQG